MNHIQESVSFNCLNGWITSVAIQVADGRRQSLWNCPWDMIVTEVPAHSVEGREKEYYEKKIKLNMKMKQNKKEALLTSLGLMKNQPRCHLSLHPPSCQVSFCKPTTIITLVRTWLKLFSLVGLKQTIVRVERVYISVMFEESQTTPCHFSPQGSPPKASQCDSDGAPKVIYKLLIAETAKMFNSKQTPSQINFPKKY